jgi:DNA-directed RNA polymerase subunit RPC12/RpoP
MGLLKCLVCGTSEDSGRIIYVCDHCGAKFCSEHGYQGKTCPKCSSGTLK